MDFAKWTGHWSKKFVIRCKLIKCDRFDKLYYLL